MLLLKSTIAAFLFPLLALSPKQESRSTRVKSPVEIKGVVVSAETGKPLPGIYLFVTEGEEEALTNAKGEFIIKTWKPLPLVLTSQNIDYHNVKVKVTQTSGMIAVKLRKK
jgi:hypothetical protein